MNWQSALDNFLKNILSIEAGEEIWLFHHADCDGCVSAIYLSALFRELGLDIKKRFWVLSSEYDLEVQKSIIKKSPPRVLIFLDLDVVTDGVFLGEWKENVERILIYDHHKIELSELKNLLSEKDGIFYLNPRLFDEIYTYPASFFCYELFKKVSEKNLRHWLLGAGLISDHALNEDSELKGKIISDYKNLTQSSTFKDMRLYEVTYLINSGYFHHEVFKKGDLSFEVAWQAFSLNDPKVFFNQDLKETQELQRRREDVDSECSKFVNLAKENANLEQKYLLCYYIISSPHYISGLVASGLTSFLPGYIIMIGQLRANKFSLEIRRGKNCDIDITKILRQQKNYYHPLSAGGHPSACGALIRSQDLEVFVETFKQAFLELWLI